MTGRRRRSTVAEGGGAPAEPLRGRHPAPARGLDLEELEGAQEQAVLHRAEAFARLVAEPRGPDPEEVAARERRAGADVRAQRADGALQLDGGARRVQRA